MRSLKAYVVFKATYYFATLFGSGNSDISERELRKYESKPEIRENKPEEIKEPIEIERVPIVELPPRKSESITKSGLKCSINNIEWSVPSYKLGARIDKALETVQIYALGSNNKIIKINLPYPLSEKKYIITPTNLDRTNVIFKIKDSTYFEYLSVKGSITITRIDIKKSKIEGIFNAELNPANKFTTNRITIINGSFGSYYNIIT